MSMEKTLVKLIIIGYGYIIQLFKMMLCVFYYWDRKISTTNTVKIKSKVLSRGKKVKKISQNEKYSMYMYRKTSRKI